MNAREINLTADLFGVGTGPNTGVSLSTPHRALDLFAFAQDGEKTSGEIAVNFMETLKIPEGPKAGSLVKLAPFQTDFVAGAMADGITAAVLSIGRGNAKTAAGKS